MYRTKFIFLLTLGLLSPFVARALTLDEFLAEVQKRNKEFQGLGTSREAAEDRRAAGDLGLSPILTLSAGYLSDEKQPQTLGTKLTSSQYSLGVAKEFSTGTKASVTGNVQQVQVANLPPIYPSYFSDYSTGSLGFSVSQSLWKNAFGAGTRLRQQRQASAATLEKENFNLQQRQILMGAETAFWNYLYQQEELKTRQESLERAQRIEAWLKRRYRDGINDKADYLNAQALTASRELLLATAKDLVRAAEQSLRGLLEMKETEALPPLKADFKKARDILTLVDGGAGKVVRLDARLADLEAQTKSLGAREVQDSLKPDLVLEGAYNTNSNVQDSPSQALNKITNTDIPTTQVGVKFTYMFDTDAKMSQESLARKEALAAQLKSEQKMIESEISWSELQRRYKELLQQISTSERLSELQMARAKEQSLKLSRGRAVTSDVINSEEDAATTSLSLNRLRAEARKMEAQSRLFIRVQE